MGLFGNKSEYEKTYEKLQNEHSGVIALSIEEDNFELVVFQGEQITKTHPQNSYGWEIMGDGYLNLEKFENAIECYEKAISLGSPNFFL